MKRCMVWMFLIVMVASVGCSLLDFKSEYVPEKLELNGYKALIITTSQATLNELDPKTGEVIKVGEKTGLYAAEMTEAYYQFLDAGMDVSVVSIKGGIIPIEPLSLRYIVRTEYDDRFMDDPTLQKIVNNSKSIEEVNFVDYDIIYMAGGWGAAYDYAQTEILVKKVTEAYAAKKVMGSVCHGALGFVEAKKPDGTPLVEGVKMTGVTNEQLKYLEIDVTPIHPETELKKFGADYQYSRKEKKPIYDNLVVVDEKHRMVTGQNQKGGVETAQKLMTLLLSLNTTDASQKQQTVSPPQKKMITPDMSSNSKLTEQVLYGELGVTKGKQGMFDGHLIGHDLLETHFSAQDGTVLFGQSFFVKANIYIHHCDPRAQCLTSGRIPNIKEIIVVEPEYAGDKCPSDYREGQPCIGAGNFCTLDIGGKKEGTPDCEPSTHLKCQDGKWGIVTESCG